MKNYDTVDEDELADRAFLADANVAGMGAAGRYPLPMALELEQARKLIKITYYAGD